MACDCFTTGSPKESLQKSEAVFTGKVVEVKQDPQHGQIVKFAVKEAWKGVAQNEVRIDPYWGSDCGYYFKKGNEYLVYATAPRLKSRSQLMIVTICSRTKTLATAKDELAELGEPAYRAHKQ